MASYANEDEWLEELAAGGRRDIGGAADAVSVDDVMRAPVAGGGGADMRARGDVMDFGDDPEALEAEEAGGPVLEMEPGAGQPRLGELMEGAAPIGDDKFMQWAANQTRGVDSMDPAVVGVAPAAHSYEALGQGGYQPTDAAAAAAAREMDDAAIASRPKLREGVTRDEYTMMNDADKRGARARRSGGAIPQGGKDFLASLFNAASGRSGGKNEMSDYLGRRDSRIAGEKAEADKGRREALQAQQRADAADRQRMLQDPNSQQNQRYQQQVRQLLGNDFDASTLTLADHQRYGGDFLKMQQASQQRAFKAAAAEGARREAAQRADELREEKRGYQVGDWEKAEAGRNRRAAMSANAIAGRAGAVRDEARMVRDEQRSRQDAERLEKDVQGYRNELSKDGLGGGVTEGLDELDAALTEGAAAHGGDTPGAGLSAWLVERAPGELGESMAESQLSPEGRRVRVAQRVLGEAFARGQSGAAIGADERVAFDTLIGKRSGTTDKQMREALDTFRAWVEKRKQGAAAAFPEGARQYEANLSRIQTARDGGGQRGGLTTADVEANPDRYERVE